MRLSLFSFEELFVMSSRFYSQEWCKLGVTRCSTCSEVVDINIFSGFPVYIEVRPGYRLPMCEFCAENVDWSRLRQFTLYTSREMFVPHLS